MKLLERVCLVQFFLYERHDIDVIRNTGFFGPNGTGKTVLLDAVQTVLLGADGHRLAYNAQADGSKRARNLRSYCLGVYNVGDKGRCRDAANTYVTLSFRDEATDEVFTAGVAASAHADSPDVQVHSLFMLPGVSLSASDFVERIDGQRDRVMPWKDAQHVLRQRVRDAGGDADRIFTTNREEFVRRLLLEYLAAPGQMPHVAQFRNAFQRSLRLEVGDDLSGALRDLLIDRGDTNIREFKARADQFRKMNDLVTRTRDQIERLGQVRDGFDKVRDHRTKEASYEGLGATLQVEALADAVDAGDEQVEQLVHQAAEAGAELARVVAERQEAHEAYEKARDLQIADPDYQKRLAASGVVGEREREAQRATQGLTQELVSAVTGLQALARVPALADDLSTFEAGAQLAMAVRDELAKERTPDVPSVEALAKAMGRSADIVQKRSIEGDRRLEEQRQRLRVARQTLDRVKLGLTPLADPVGYLKDRLEEAGIGARPVCDLVEITEPAWQAVIEGYLGLNVQALLVPRAQLEAAVRIHRKLPAAVVAGAKLVSHKHLERWRRRDGQHGKFAAELITGSDEDAIAFLQGNLGAMTCVSTEAELIAARNGFTTDGMISRNGAIERRALPPLLQIGRQDRGSAKLRAEREARELQDAVLELEKHQKLLTAAAGGLAAYAAQDATRARWETAFAQLGGMWRAVKEARDAQLTATSGNLAALDALVSTRREAVTRLDDARLAWSTKQTQAETRLETARTELAANRTALEHARVLERNASRASLYDATEANRQRARLEETYPDEAVTALVARCAENARRNAEQASKADTNSSVELSRYLLEFSVNADIGADWLAKLAYCRGEHGRLSSLTLAERVADAEAALKAAEEVFRNDVVHALCNGFDAVERQVAALNTILKQAPEFSNRERYVFRNKPVDQHRTLYDFVRRAREEGLEESLFSDAAHLPAEFRELMGGDANSPLLQDTSPLNDYRRFFAYDFQIYHEDESVGMLSKRFGPGSGGEHKVPLYLITGAALAAAYGNLHGHNRGGALMLLDEAFDKIDSANATAVVDYLNRLGLQLIMTGPETEQTKLTGFLHCYYDMSRDGSRVVRLEQTIVNEEARELLLSDSPRYHPDLLDRELERLRALESHDDAVAADS